MRCGFIKRATLLLASVVPVAMAANYKVTTTYDGGNLYYAIYDRANDEWYENKGRDCFSATNTFNFEIDSKYLANYELNFYTDNQCQGRLSSGAIPLKELFPSSQQAKITVYRNGDWEFTNAANPGPGNPQDPENPGKQDPDPGQQDPGQQDPEIPVKNGMKIVAFFTPWSNTNATIFVGIDDQGTGMIPMDRYCGWFIAGVQPPSSGLNVYFKQTIGPNYVDATGITTNPTMATEINLDSAAALSDTIWVQGNKEGAPSIYTEHPVGVLGDCPLKKLPVMMFDWLHGNKGDGVNGNGNPEYGTSADFGSGGCSGSPMLGMVEPILGANGVPVRAANFPNKCNITEHLDYWFLPETLAVDAKGNSLTNMTCRDLYISMDDEGFWLAEISKDAISKGNEANKGGMFLLDDFKYLDEDQTVPNPYYDQLRGGSDSKNHNFGFTMKVQATFEYLEGQKFDFLGDDDVWVFINNRLVVDIGGQHAQVRGSVDLDTLGLTVGETYPFHIFYAERHTSLSNFRMHTSIDLKTEASIMLKKVTDNNNVITREVWQKVRKNRLACDFSNSSAELSEERGPSSYILFGGNLPSTGVELSSGLSYGGITISNTFDSFSIDKDAIKSSRSLVPGVYYLRVTLQSDNSQFKDVYFVVDAYDLPTIAYATPSGTLLGPAVRSDSLQLNLSKDTMWVGQSYKVYIQYAEDWALANNSDMVYPFTDDPSLVPCDSLGNPITEVKLTEGKGSFYVKAVGEVLNGTLAVKGQAASNTATWKGILVMVPPVPQILAAYIFDRNGDGRGDSIWIELDDNLGGKNLLDSATFTFGEPYATVVPYYNNGGNTATITTKDRTTTGIRAASDNGFWKGIFTGGIDKPYSGQIKLWYTHKNGNGLNSVFTVEGLLVDKIGPVITKAEVEYMKDGTALLALTYSEGIVKDIVNSEHFDFVCWNDGVRETAVKTVGGEALAWNQWKLVFPKGASTDVIPAVGDSVRFRPHSQGGITFDLAQTGPHENNAWVRITGEQRVTITSPKVVTLQSNSDAFEYAKEIIQNPEATVTRVAPDTVMNAEQAAAAYGTQGHFLGDLDMAELAQNEIANIVTAVKSTPTYMDHWATPNADGSLPTKNIEDIIAEVGSGQLSIRDAQKRYWVDPVIVEAYENGILDQNNVHNFARGSEADVQVIVAGVAQSTSFSYKTSYFSSLGQYVNGASGNFNCNSEMFKKNGQGTCLDNNGKLFLAWNMRAKNGRLASTGVYIARLEYRIKVGGKTIVNRTQDFLWGYRRGKVTAFDLGL